MNSCIYEGRVRHRRFLPAERSFSYRLFMMYVDLADLPQLFDPYRLWSARGPALAWFRRTDHMGDPGRPLDVEVRRLVEERTGKYPVGPVRLLTHFRYFGYCMNPVSFYYCWDPRGESLEAVVAEVHNTPWGERHCYVVNGPSTGRQARGEFSKSFHVSPFMPMNHMYRWSLSTPGHQLVVHMENLEKQEERLVFDATLLLRRQDLNGENLNRYLLRYPFMTGKVIGTIYWQALRIWARGFPFYSHPKHSEKAA